MSMDEMRRKVQADLEEARKAFKQRRAALDKALEDIKVSGEDITSDNDKFAEFKENFGTPAQEAANRVRDAEVRWNEVLDMAGAMGIAVPSADIDTASAPKVERQVRTIRELISKRLADSPEYKAAAERIGKVGFSGARMDPIELLTRDELVDFMERKALVTGASATSAGAAVLNDFLPGSVDRAPFAPNRLLDVIPVGRTDSDTVDYLVEDAFTNAAAETAEATIVTDGALPESAATFTRVQDPVELVGHFIPVTTRGLEDYGQLESLLERRLIGGVLNRIENQVYDGNGTAPNLSGITDRAGILSQALGADSRSDAILKAMTGIRIGATVNDTMGMLTVAVHPSDWQDIRLEKDANGNYIYGPPTGPVGFSMWGYPVVQAISMTAGTGLVGAFDECELFVRRGLSVESSNTHSDWFIREIVALKATTRLTFVVYKPAAFSNVTGI